jgi:hypothetical protein
MNETLVNGLMDHKNDFYGSDGGNLPGEVKDLSLTKKIELDGSCNTTDEVLLAQVNENIRRGLRQVKPHSINPSMAILVCGGPSLEETKESLVRAYWAGAKVIAVNGAYDWCIENNIKPSACVLLDAREFSSRFVEKEVLGCRYLLASQCHPKAFEICKDRDVFIWHACSGGDAEVEILQEYYFNRTYPVTIGTTVGVRAISLLRMLGFAKIMIFGLDSCWLDDKNHAYEQIENDKDRGTIIPVWLRPENRDDKAQRFLCSPWMIKQAEDFLELMKERAELFELSIYGPGLIASMLRTGAEIQLEERN